MKNAVLFKMLIDEYNRLSFTHQYVFGFESEGIIYASFATSEVLETVCTLDMASRDAGCALRFKPNKMQKEYLKQFRLVPLCSAQYFEAVVKSCKYNRGEIFEKMVTEMFGQVWEKDNLPFTIAGDLEADGIAYQIKFEKATFINEKTLARMRVQ